MGAALPGEPTDLRKLFFCAVLGFAALALSGCHHDGPTPVSPATPAATPSAPRDSAVVYVINPKATGDQDVLMPRTVALHHSASPARDAVDALLRAKGSPLPTGTALRGITIDAGVATLDFSQSPISETGGEGAQGDALAALARTLGQFPEINQYQIEVKGQAVKSLGEQGAVDGPMDVIRPAGPPQAKDAAP